MQETSPTIITAPSRFAWFTSLGLLILTLISGFGLFGYQFITDARIETLQEEIAVLDTELASAAKDRDIIVANILAGATLRPSIDLQSLVRGFRVAATQAGVRLQGFSVQDDIISTTLTASRDTSETDPVKIIIDMMRSDLPNTGLSLVPISSIAGSSDERTTNITFRILPTNSATNATK